MNERKINLAYVYRLQPTRSQHRALESILETQRRLYNEMLDWKQLAWETLGTNISRYDFYRWVSRRPECCSLPSRLCRHTINRVDLSFGAFFRRVKAGQTPGYPRFKSRDRFRSFGFTEFSGIRLKDGRLLFKGVPSGLRVRFHRPLPDGAKICAAVVKTDSKGWRVCFQLEVPLPANQTVPTAKVGIDVGLTHLAALSSGEYIPNLRITRKGAKAVRVHQRALARCKHGSNRRRKVKAKLVRVYERQTNARTTYLHQVSARIVKTYGFIAHEKLAINRMVHGTLAKSIHDAAWGTLFQFVGYKAANAGSAVVGVDPRGTTQLCSGCGSNVPKGLADRTHSCDKCGLVLCRDLNAARNILNRAVVRPWFQNVAGYRERGTGIVSAGVSQ